MYFAKNNSKITETSASKMFNLKTIRNSKLKKLCNMKFKLYCIPDASS